MLGRSPPLFTCLAKQGFLVYFPPLSRAEEAGFFLLDCFFSQVGRRLPEGLTSKLLDFASKKKLKGLLFDFGKISEKMLIPKKSNHMI